MSRQQRQKAKHEAMVKKARAWKGTPGTPGAGEQILANLNAAAETRPLWMTDPAVDREMHRNACEAADAWARSADGTPYGRREA